jgi:hypothetical protein
MESAKGRRRYGQQQADELTQLATFRWQRGTYEWVEARPLQLAASRAEASANRNAVYLVERVMEGDKPDDSPDAALFREFADVPLSREGVLNFANKYGWLGVGPLTLVIPRKVCRYPIREEVASEMETLLAQGNRARILSHPTEAYPVQPGERPAEWFKEIAAMSQLLRVFDPPGGADPLKKRFEQRVIWTTNEVIYELQTDDVVEKELIVSKQERPQLFALLKKANLREILRWYLELSIDKRLAAHEVKVRLLRDSASGRVGLRVVPQSLIGFLWLQFAKAVEGNKSYRRCEDCGKWFELGGQSSRSDKRFCTDTCRVRNDRKRKAPGRIGSKS